MSRINPELSSKITNMSLICSLMVVLLHSGTPQQFGTVSWYISKLVFTGVTGIAVPFFFLISGFLLGQHAIDGAEFVSELKKRVCSLLIPFYFWNFAFWLFVMALTIGVNLVQGLPWSRNVSLCNSVDLLGLSLSMPLGPMWYIRTLFLLVCMSPLIVRLNRKPIWLVVPLIGIFSYLLIAPELPISESPIKVACRFVFSPSALLYFSVGLLWARIKISKGISGVTAGICLTLGMLILALRALISLSPGYDLALRELSVPFILLGIWKIVPARSMFFVEGRTSFLIYVLHPFVYLLLDAGFKHGGLFNWDNWLLYSLHSLLGVLLTIALAVVVERLPQGIVNVMSGGRLGSVRRERSVW